MEVSRINAAIKAGIIPDEILDEMRRWGLPVRFVVYEDVQMLNSPEEVVRCIRDALESEEIVETRDTDLDILHRYLTQQKKGSLHIEDGEASANTSIFYCVTDLGEYVIPWRYESVRELILDPKSYLRDDSGKKVHFQDVRELFYGGIKAFIVCEPVKETA